MIATTCQLVALAEKQPLIQFFKFQFPQIWKGPAGIDACTLSAILKLASKKKIR